MKRDGNSDFCEGKQHQREGGIQDEPQQCSQSQPSTAGARRSCTAKPIPRIAVQNSFQTCACNVSVPSGIQFKGSPAEAHGRSPWGVPKLPPKSGYLGLQMLFSVMAGMVWRGHRTER